MWLHKTQMVKVQQVRKREFSEYAATLELKVKKIEEDLFLCGGDTLQLIR